MFGHDYQGRLFLRYAAELRVPGSNIARVGYEHRLLRAFDDVTVHYEVPELDEQYGLIAADFFQIKFQLRQDEPVTCASLSDPAFINASSVSLLERVCDASREMRESGVLGRLILLSPRRLADDLHGLLENTSGALQLDVLLHGRRHHRLRDTWARHLALDSTDDLSEILAPLRIRQSPTLEELQDAANIALREAGLRSWERTERANRYDDLPRKLVQSAMGEFDRDSIEGILRKERLVVGPPISRLTSPRRVGIRSYVANAERLADEVEALCSLETDFDGRRIRDPDLWEGSVRQKLESFLEEVTSSGQPLDLVISAHVTIAFAAGWRLDTKARVDAAPVQGDAIWRPARDAPRPAVAWTPPVVQRLGDGRDVALCISVTHSVLGEVSTFVLESLPGVGSLVHLQIPGDLGHRAVRDGTHALHLAESAIDEVVRHLPRGEPRATVHVFIAAPNGFVYFLGRLAARLGRVALYEYDFPRREEAPYHLSLVFDAS